MAKISVFGHEISACDIAKGAMITAGAAFVAVGVKRFFDAKDIQYDIDDLNDEDPDFDELLLEEYKDELRTRYYRAKMHYLASGALSAVLGVAAMTVGILSFTPFKKYFIKNSALTDIRKKLQALKLKKGLADAEIMKIVSELKTADIRKKIEDLDLADKFSEIDVKGFVSDLDIKDRLPDFDIKDRISEFDIKDKISDIDIKNIIKKVF